MDKQIIELDTKSVVKSVSDVTENLAETSRFTINSQPTFEKAKERLIEIKSIKKVISEKKDSVVKPLNEALKNVRSLFKPVEEKIDVIENYLKDGVLSYQRKLNEEIAKREAEALKKIKEQEAKGEEVNMDKVVAPIQRVENKIEAIKTRKVKKLRIVDVNLIPRDYLLPDEVKIKTALIQGVEVSGCEIYEEEIAVNSY